MTEPEPYAGPCRRKNTPVENLAQQVADKIARDFVAQDTRSDWQDEVNKLRYKTIRSILRSLGIGVGISILCFGIIAAFTLSAYRRADAAALRADKAGSCASFLLGSIAANKVDQRAVDLGCDTTIAVELIDRGNARDAAIKAAREQSRVDACGLVNVLIPASAPSNPAVEKFRKDFQC